jgi:exosortase B
MSTVFEDSLHSRQTMPRWVMWLPVAIGLGALYLPTFFSLSGGLWNEEAYSHGPIILAVVAWLAWEKRTFFFDGAPTVATLAGIACQAAGLLIYVVGRSQQVVIFEVGSLIPVLVGAMLLLRGWRGLRQFWFPLVFLIFLVPLPGFIVDGITGPLKAQVSHVVENMLYAAGYPIGRHGVMLTIGTYQLQVADACSGLNSMFSLTALGMLYLYMVKVPSVMRNAMVMGCILPIAFAANIIRVSFLVLITYHFGDDAGQGFLHGFAGMVLFLAALLMLIGVDHLIRLLPAVRNAARQV